MEEQQEFYRIIQNVPRQTKDVLKALSFLIDELRGKFSSTYDSKRTIRKEQDKIQRENILSHQDKQTAGEKSMDFMVRDGKMIAEPQTFNSDVVNLGQLKNHLDTYKLQFHIEHISPKEFELHFFSKDNQLTAKALERAMIDLAKDPSKITSKDLEGEIIHATEKQAQIREQVSAQKADKKTPESVLSELDKKVADKVQELAKADTLLDGSETSLFGSEPPVDELVR